MAVMLITALYLTILVWAAVQYVRRRDPLLRDVMWIFATVASLFVLGLIRLAIGQPPRMVSGLFVALLLGQPFFTLRLVSRLRRVPAWLLWTAVVGWVATSVPVVLARGPLSPQVTWAALGMFVVMELTAATLLVREGRRRGGAARSRLWCAAAGTALFGVALGVAGGGAALAVHSRVLAVVSALMYMLAFLPPRWLRRAWSWGAAYTVMRRMVAAPVHEPARDTWLRYCQGARDVLGADDVAVLLPTPAGDLQPVLDDRSLPSGRYDQEDLDRLLSPRVTIDALAGWTRPPRMAVDLAQACDARYVTAAPLAVSGRQGALVLVNRFRTLFADDDVALFADLASPAAALAERAETLAERQRLAVIVESSHDAIVGKTLDGFITSWNAAARQMYGYEAQEAVGQHAAMLFPPDQQEVENQLMARVVAGERIDQYQVQRRRKDGATVTVSLTMSPIVDETGRTVGVASISRDLSERQRAEAMFRGLLEAAPDAIIGVTQDGRIALINAQAERLFGYHREELLGQTVDVLVPERHRGKHPEHRQHYFARPQSRPMGAGMALSAVRKDGTEFPAEISLSSLETDQGVIVSAAVRDVTQRLAEQAERERLAAQAERDAAERRLQHTRRLESLGQLAGGVAHDFNNILGVIASYTELVTDALDTPAPDPDELVGVRRDLGQITRATERAARLTKQLLAFGRREITQSEVLNVNHVIGDVEQMLRRTLGEHIHLVTQLDPDLGSVCADPSQLEQILVNLAVNARDAMPSGGTLSIDTANRELDGPDATAYDLAPGCYVRMRVSDTGTGMPAEVAERAFEPFYTTKPQGAGTGLGLATVYGIATAAGGHVRLYSEAGIGTTVTILLPAVDTPAGPASPEPDPAAVADSAPGTTPQETVLLVEDEDALRDVTGRVLARAGYRVLVAHGGGEAIQLAQTHAGPIHLLLTDVIMPRMMGNEVADRVQAIRPAVPVVYMSGYAQPVLAENGTLQPGVTIIEKPFTSRELLDRIRAVLDQAAAGSAAIGAG